MNIFQNLSKSIFHSSSSLHHFKIKILCQRIQRRTCLLKIDKLKLRSINLCNKVFSCNVFIHSKAEQPQTHHQGNKQIEQTSCTQRGGALKLVTSCNKNFLP